MRHDPTRDCPDCGGIASVRDGLCDLCLADLGKHPSIDASGPPALAPGPAFDDADDLWFSEAWFS